MVEILPHHPVSGCVAILPFFDYCRREHPCVDFRSSLAADLADRHVVPVPYGDCRKPVERRHVNRLPFHLKRKALGLRHPPRLTFGGSFGDNGCEIFKYPIGRKPGRPVRYVLTELAAEISRGIRDVLHIRIPPVGVSIATRLLLIGGRRPVRKR